MQAYKVKGAIDESGHLIINELIKIAPGEVEVIVLQTVEAVDNDIRAKNEPQVETPKKQL